MKGSVGKIAQNCLEWDGDQLICVVTKLALEMRERSRERFGPSLVL